MKVDLFLAFFSVHGKTTYKGHMDDIQVHTTDIRMTYEYLLFFSLLLGMLIGVDKE